MKIALGSDHGGLDLKNEIIEHLKQKNIDIKDFGTYTNDAADYADFALSVCNAVTKKEADYGILICGTGIGMSMAANKIAGIRCAVLGDVFSAKATRSHNDANVMAMGARVTGAGLAIEIVDAFLQTAFSGDARHVNRIGKITNLEKR